MAVCPKCKKQVGCGCNLKGGLCSTCRGVVVPLVVNPPIDLTPQIIVPDEPK